MDLCEPGASGVTTASGRVSRSALKTLDVEGKADGNVRPDVRSENLRVIAVAQDAELINALEAVFDGTDVMRNREKAALLVQVRHEVFAEWNRARQSFLTIGRALLSLQQRLTPEEFRRLENGADRVFPFSRTVLVQLRQVAQAVAFGKIEEREMPGSYSVAYQLVTMDDPTMEIARARNLVRPNVTRSEIIAFRRAVSVELQAKANRVDLAAIRNEKVRLLRIRGELASRLAQIDSRLADLSDIET